MLGLIATTYNGHEEFYGVLAQVLPVVVGVIVFETRRFTPKHAETNDLGGLVIWSLGAFLVLIAEVVAITATYTGGSAFALLTIIITTVIGASLPLTALLVMHLITPGLSPSAVKARSRLYYALAFGSTLVLLVFAVIAAVAGQS
jgi:hypothetical protein